MPNPESGSDSVTEMVLGSGRKKVRHSTIDCSNTKSSSEGMRKPQIAAEINDPAENLKAFVVVDSLEGQMAMGGVRMTDSVSEASVSALARAMTTKLSLVDLPIGGAKAGIVPVPERRREVIQAFGRSVAPLLHGGIYLGCDQGTTYDDRSTMFAAANYDVLRDVNGVTLPTDWATFWKNTADITGYGVSVATATAISLTRHGGPCSIVIQGFGTVGRALAKLLEDDGHRIVAVADIHGTIHDARGLPVRGLMKITDSAGTIDRSRLPQSVKQTSEPESWIDVPADVLALAAGGNAVRADNVGRIRADIVVEGGNLCCSADAKQTLVKSNIVVVPDVVANVGGAAATGCILTQQAPRDITLETLVPWLFDWVARRVRENTRQVLEVGCTDVDPVNSLLVSRGRKTA